MPRPTPSVKRGCYADDITVLAGVHDQQLPERCKHLPEGKLVFDLCADINSHILHPRQTPVPGATGVHKMGSIGHLYQESHTLKVNDHSDMPFELSGGGQ